MLKLPINVRAREWHENYSAPKSATAGSTQNGAAELQRLR